MAVAGDNRSLGDLIGELAREAGTLVRQEVTLARTELSEKATRVGRDVGFLVAGGAVAYGGFLAVLAAIILALGLVIPLWLAALLVGLVVIAIGYVIVRQGLDALKREDLTPRQTVETMKENVEWVRHQTG